MASVRAAAVDDAVAIATAHVHAWQAAYARLLPAGFLAGLSVGPRARKWAGIIAAADGEIAVAEDDGQVLAFVSFGPCRDAQAPAGRGEVWALYARPDAWGRGLGRALLGHALQRLQAQGFREVSLWVLAGNERGLRFYRAAGFSTVDGSQIPVTLGGTTVQEVQMLRALAG